MAPQYSTLSVAKYGDAVEAARPPEHATCASSDSWHDHPDLLDAFAEKLRAARAGRGVGPRALHRPQPAHARVVAQGDPYPDEVAATARGVAERAGVPEYARAYQSAGRTPESWLGPPLEEALATAAAEGAQRVLAVPVGFVCDHTGDPVRHRRPGRSSAARRLGIEVGRTESLNTSPTLHPRPG